MGQTLQRLESVLQAHGLTIFGRVDHNGEAEKAGLKMRPTQLLIFGSPKAGTPMMVASPTLAIDLPLKALAWEDAAGAVWLSYWKRELENVLLPMLEKYEVVVVEAPEDQAHWSWAR